MEFSRQEYWSGLPFPSPGDLPDPGIKPGSPTLQADALPSEPQHIVEYYLKVTRNKLGFPGSSAGKESACNAGDPRLIPELGGSPGEGKGLPIPIFLCFPSGSDSKESACIVVDLSLIPGLGRSRGERHANPLQYSLQSVGHD